jgi:hypothetical protein
LAKSEDWPFVGENPEILDLCESEEHPAASRDLAYQRETEIGWIALGLARICTDTAPRRPWRVHSSEL